MWWVLFVGRVIHALYASVFVIAACGLSYELIAGTLASYLLGDSVLQFSTIIGAYLFAMGVGSYLSRHIRRHAVLRFIEIEIAVGLLGGFSTSLLLTAYAHSLPFRFCLYLIVFLIGVLVGDLGDDPDADRCRHPFFSGFRKGEGFHAPSNSFRGQHGFPGTGVGQHHQKLVTPVTPDHIGVANRSADHLRDFAQHGVAEGVPVGVVLAVAVGVSEGVAVAVALSVAVWLVSMT
jgi:hypothetical protein